MTADCPLCGDEFTSETGASDHAWDVHGACSYCGESFDDEEALYAHWLEAHEGELAREDRTRAERKAGDRTVCPACGTRFDGEARVRDHAWDDHGVCHHCGEGFDDEETLYAHWLAVHEDELAREDRERARSAVGSLSFGQRLTHEGPVAALSEARVGRRTLLYGGAIAGALAVGSVLGDELGGGSGSDQPLADHPAAADLGAQPRLGPDPAESVGTIVAFEDPSCPSCARFERQSFPEVKSRLVEGEDVAFVFRGIPVINSWGQSATDDAVQAMEATYAREPAAFWSLKAFYYREQRNLGSGNVLDRTRQFLADETDVDAGAVLDAVESGTYRGAVDADLQASRDAGVRGTPTFFLFRDGSYVTETSGVVSADVFANSLGV